MKYLLILKNKRTLLLLLAFLVFQNMFAQTKSYDVTLCSFSTLSNDEFSPAYYKNRLVFCSNLKNNSLITYKDEQKKLFNIFYVNKKGNSHWGVVGLLAKELTTNYNEGPASFTGTGDSIYYCRNTNVRQQLKDNSDADNKLGIFSAVFAHGEWTDIRPFPYNNPEYSLVTPAITADGKRLYFASDMPGGYGGSDLYYSDWKGNAWAKPVNMGPDINSDKNESYPFVSKSGKLFFASDGLTGFGGKDLFFTQEIDGNWIHPIHLEADINSPADDFGLITDEDSGTGYFSSNRRKTDDIYSFKASMVQFPVCDTMVKNTYCFLFYDEFQVKKDTVPVTYEWDFGNGIKKYGPQVKYCFSGPGKYEVNLNLLDAIRRDSIHSRTSYNFELTDVDQVFINSPDAGIVNEAIPFDGLKTNLPGFRISDYVWNFSEGFLLRGPVAKKVFNKKGEYIVQLGLLGDKDSIGNFKKLCSLKKINIYDDFLELAMYNSKNINEMDEFRDIGKRNKLQATPEKPLNNKKTGDVAPESNFFAVRIYLMNNLSELQKDKIVINLYRTYSTGMVLNESGIDNASEAVLNEFIAALKESPDLKLEIAVHTGDKGLARSNLEISEKKALDLRSYFNNHGITDMAIHCKGYGESRPVNDNLKGENNLNRRIEFVFSDNRN